MKLGGGRPFLILFLSVFHLYFHSDMDLICISILFCICRNLEDAAKGADTCRSWATIVLEEPSKDNGATSQLSEYPRLQYLANSAKKLANTKQWEAESEEYILESL